VIAVASVLPARPPPGLLAAVEPDVPAWRLRGMATAEGWRGRGVGRGVLAAVVEHICGAGGGLLWCHARLSAAQFYERAGLVKAGEPWEEPVIGPHVVMWRLVVPSARPG